MASIRKRGSSYLIVVSMGYDYNGKRIKPQQKTVHPPEELTPRQVEKWLNEQAVLFERECRHTPQPVQQLTLAKYIDIWLEQVAPKKLAASTLVRDKQDIRRILPALGHYKLAELEKSGKLKGVITQNIDGLHQKAGSKKVLELHGSIHRNRCQSCHSFFTLEDMLKQKDGIPKCPNCHHTIKPEVVLYGESLDMQVMEEAVTAIANADVMIIGGTSLVVYPAAGLLRYFRGKTLVLLNKEVTAMDDQADIVIHDPIGEVLQEVVLHNTKLVD